jgi:spermidine synthase
MKSPQHAKPDSGFTTMTTNFSDIIHKPDGIIHKHKGAFQTTIIEKSGHELRLKLLSEKSTEWQSRIDLTDPAKLFCPYMEVIMLMLLWQSDLIRIHILGLGGGSLAMFFRKHFPNLFIDSTEIDRDVYDLAVKYFGFEPDSNLKVFIEDGRDFLTSRSTDNLYDAILIDAFRGVGFSPVCLSTQEFLRVCKTQLRPNGILVANLLPTDGLLAERLATMESVFRSVYVSRADGAFVVFASDAERILVGELVRRASVLQDRHKFNFAYEGLAQSIAYVTNEDSVSKSTEKPPLLTDSTPPGILAIPELLISSLGRNDQCPCGSGRKFKKCHGLIPAAASIRT